MSYGLNLGWGGPIKGYIANLVHGSYVYPKPCLEVRVKGFGALETLIPNA